MLSIICPSHVSLPNVTPALLPASDNVILNVSNPSVTLSQVTDTLALPSVAPELIVMLNGLEIKSLPDPINMKTVLVIVLKVISYALTHS